MMKESLGLLSVILGCAGFAPYFSDIFKKKTKPHALTWIVWSILNGIVFIAQFNHHAGAGMWSMGFGFMASLTVAIIALVQGEKNIQKSDVVAFVAALFAILLWRLTGNALLAVVLAAMIELLSYYPTFRKSYAQPDQETVFLYEMDTLCVLFALLALEDFSLINALYPIIVVITNTAFVCMVLWRRRLALRVSL